MHLAAVDNSGWIRLVFCGCLPRLAIGRGSSCCQSCRFGIAIGLCGLLASSISTLVLGLASAIVGDAVIYGIHVYGAARQEASPYAAARRIAKPLLVGMLTTLAVFAASSFSRIPAYRQLGLMASVSLLLSLLTALYLLPALLPPGRSSTRRQGYAAAPVGPADGPDRPAGLGPAGCRRLPRNPEYFRLRHRAVGWRQPGGCRRRADFQRTWGRGDGELAIVVGQRHKPVTRPSNSTTNSVPC